MLPLHNQGIRAILVHSASCTAGNNEVMHAHHHAEERPVNMDVEPVLIVPAISEYLQNSVKIVHSALHCRPAVDIHYGRP